MVAVAPLEFLVPAARKILGRLGEGSEALGRDADALVEIVTELMERSPELVLRDVTDEQVALERIVVLRFVVDAVTGPLRRGVRIAAPDLAERFDDLADRFLGWGREAAELLEQRLELLRSSERIMEEHDETYRVLAR
jgi:hypothetical protein